MDEVGYIIDQEWNKCNLVIKDSNEVGLKDVQYKLTNKSLVIKSFLHRIRKIEDNLCAYCKQFYYYLSSATKLKNFGILCKYGIGFACFVLIDTIID